MTSITANELKTKGVTALEPLMKEEHTATITVRGEPRYVVMDIQKYNRMREYELEGAILESQKDIENGDYMVESVGKHIERITGAL